MTRRLSDEQINKIIETYNKNNGNASKTARELNYNLTTVLKYLEKAGIETSSYRFSGEDIMNMISAYFVFNGNTTQASKELGFSYTSVLKYWHIGGLKSKKSRYDDFNGSGLKYFLAHPEKYEGLSRFELAKKDSGLYRTLLRQGNLEKAIPEKLPLGAGRPPLPQEQVKEIIDSYRPCDGNAAEAARRTGFTCHTIYRYWYKAKLKPKGKRGPKSKK